MKFERHQKGETLMLIVIWVGKRVNLCLDNLHSASLNSSYNEWGLAIGNRQMKDKCKNNSWAWSMNHSKWNISQWVLKISGVINSLNTSQINPKILQYKGLNLTNSNFNCFNIKGSKYNMKEEELNIFQTDSQQILKRGEILKKESFNSAYNNVENATPINDGKFRLKWK